MAVAAALASLTLVLGVATALALLTATEVALSGQQRRAAEAIHAAEAAAEMAADELLAIADWDGVLSGAVRSAFTDGAAAGVRRTPAGQLDLAAETNQVRCGQRSGCTAAGIETVSAERPWGPDNPVWQPYAYGALAALFGEEASTPPTYVVVWVGDDGRECDGRPDRDGAPCIAGENPGAGVLVLQSVAFGAGGSQRGVEVTVARAPAPGVDPSRRTGIVSWREIQ